MFMQNTIYSFILLLSFNKRRMLPVTNNDEFNPRLASLKLTTTYKKRSKLTGKWSVALSVCDIQVGSGRDEQTRNVWVTVLAGEIQRCTTVLVASVQLAPCQYQTLKFNNDHLIYIIHVQLFLCFYSCHVFSYFYRFFLIFPTFLKIKTLHK